VRVPIDFPNIAAAITAAPDGFTVLLAKGLYTGAQNTNLNFAGKQLKLRSADGPDGVTIDCEGKSRFITFDHSEDARSSISGLTVRNCGFSFEVEGGIYVLGAAPLISGNVFENTSGTTIFGFNGSPVIEKNVFRNTACDDQFIFGVVAFVNSSSPYIANNIFVGNQCRAINMTLPEGAAPVVVNNTIVGNRAGIYIDRRVSTALHWYSNNLIAGNERGIDAVLEFSPLTDDLAAVWQNNLVFGNIQDYLGTLDLTGQQGNLRVDPLFVSAPGNLRLKPGSPAANSGNPLHAPNDDFDGRPRSGVVDIGAFELQ
jgi:hypothetical protein